MSLSFQLNSNLSINALSSVLNSDVQVLYDELERLGVEGTINGLSTSPIYVIRNRWAAIISTPTSVSSVSEIRDLIQALSDYGVRELSPIINKMAVLSGILDLTNDNVRVKLERLSKSATINAQSAREVLQFLKNIEVNSELVRVASMGLNLRVNNKLAKIFGSIDLECIDPSTTLNQMLPSMIKANIRDSNLISYRTAFGMLQVMASDSLIYKPGAAQGASSMIYSTGVTPTYGYINIGNTFALPAAAGNTYGQDVFSITSTSESTISLTLFVPLSYYFRNGDADIHNRFEPAANAIYPLGGAGAVSAFVLAYRPQDALSPVGRMISVFRAFKMDATGYYYKGVISTPGRGVIEIVPPILNLPLMYRIIDCSIKTAPQDVSLRLNNYFSNPDYNIIHGFKDISCIQNTFNAILSYITYLKSFNYNSPLLPLITDILNNYPFSDVSDSSLCDVEWWLTQSMVPSRVMSSKYNTFFNVVRIVFAQLVTDRGFLQYLGEN